jgi:AraC-like DNA-binding protein
VYREFRPGGDVVDCVWMSTRRGVQRVVPDGCMDIIWFNEKLIVAGPDTTAHLAHARTDTVGVRFRPGVAPGFLGVPGHALTNLEVPLADLWPTDRVERLAEDLARQNRPGLVLLEATKPAQPDTFAEEVRRLAGNDVRGIAAKLGLSERQLHRRCLTRFGYGPKTLHRVLRFSRAMDLAHNGRPFADIAHQTGYADQAHFAREVRSLAGETLTNLVRKPT